MERLIIGAAIAAVAIVVAVVVDHRKPDSPTGGSGHVPMQLDRDDFADPETAWVLLVFTSATCRSCAKVWKQAIAIDRPNLSVQGVGVEAAKEIHERYRIDAVPLALLVDSEGVTQRFFLGPTAPGEIEEAAARLVG